MRVRHRGPAAIVCLGLTALIGAGAIPPAVPVQAATACAVTGRWDLVDTDAGGARYSGPLTISAVTPQGTFRWTWVSGWTGTGTIAGSTVTLNGGGSGYTARWNGTINAACTSITGRWTQNNGQGGAFAIKRAAAAAAPSGCAGGIPIVLYTNSNPSGVTNGPSGRTAFTLNSPACISDVTTY